MGRQNVRRASPIVVGLLVVGLIGAALIALTVVLMVSYDLRRHPAYECAPVEQGGRMFYPCSSGAIYETSPSGIALLVNFLTGQPEPEPQRWYTP